MSTILKALRRLENEREVEAPDLRDQVLADAPPRDARPRFPLLVGAGAIGAVLVVAGFMSFDSRFDSKEAVAPAAVPEATTGPRPSATPTEIVLPAPRPEFQEPTRATRPVRPRREPSPLPRARQPLQPAEPPIIADASHRAASTPAPRAASRPAPEAPRPVAKAVEAPAPTPARVAASPPTPAPVAAPPPTLEPAPAATPDPEVVEAVEKIAGIMGQPEVATRSPLPRMIVERTLWHPRSERRLAFLKVEGRAGLVELREGDAVGDAVVQQIDPSAVVFLHRGVEIRHRIGAGD
ncbi:MAG: hypothetical protein JRH10_20295 [Deltaproteobacteria bacterium]|nr:hypothetical protein [Deltaproteobacteria bacterium]